MSTANLGAPILSTLPPCQHCQHCQLSERDEVAWMYVPDGHLHPWFWLRQAAVCPTVVFFYVHLLVLGFWMTWRAWAQTYHTSLSWLCWLPQFGSGGTLQMWMHHVRLPKMLTPTWTSRSLFLVAHLATQSRFGPTWNVQRIRSENQLVGCLYSAANIQKIRKQLLSWQPQGQGLQKKELDRWL